MDSAALAHIVRAVANDAWDDARRHLDATVANLLEATPPKVRGALWRLLEPRRAADRSRVEAVLPYPEDTAGGMMNTDAVAVRPWHSIELVLRYLRRRQTLPDGTDNLFVVNAAGQYLGALPVARFSPRRQPPRCATRWTHRWRPCP